MKPVDRKNRFFQQRTVWFPTPLGWSIGFLAIILPALGWLWKGESFLARTDRAPADVLIVEGWIGRAGLEAAKVEFETGGYRYLVTGGGLSRSDWDHQQWNYAHEAAQLLVYLGLPPDKVIEAPAPDSIRQRTFVTALAVRQVLSDKGLHFNAANVFTVGAHARRSRLVFAKVLDSRIQVGVVSTPYATYRPEPWWRSSERADAFIKETVGYFFELLLNSGRTSNSRSSPAP